MTTPNDLIPPTPEAAPEESARGASGPPGTPLAERAGRPKRHPKRRRWLWWLIAVLVVAPPILWIVGTRSFVTRRTILSLAGGKIGADLTASSVVVDLDGTIVLRDAIARAPGIKGDGGVLFSVHRMEIKVDWTSVMDAVPRFTSVTLDAPLLRVSQDVNDGSLNIDKVQLAAPASAPKLSEPPTVRITRGVLELGEHAGEGYTSLRRLNIEGSITRSTTIVDQWLIGLTEIVGPGGGTPLRVAGQIDSKGLSLTMDGMTLGEWTDANVPSLLRNTFRQLALQGRVGKTTFAFSESGEVEATMELAGMSLNLPVDTQPAEDRDGNKIPLPPEQVGRQLRMEDVRGTLSYTDGFISGDFTGNLEELPYHVKLTYGGTSGIAPFTLVLTCSGFELRKNPQIMRFAPGVAQRRFAQFSQPTGIVDATVTVRRPAPVEGKASDLSVAGDIVMRDGSASFERFPYLFEKMRGHWRFSEDELEIVQLQGESSSGAKCFGFGRISPLTDEAGADIQVEITDLPVDDRLVEALGTKRKIVDALFNREQYQQLADRGLVLTPEHQGELSARLRALNDGATPARAGEKEDIEGQLRHPVFSFGGKARVYVDVQRAAGPEGIWLDTITINLPNAGLVPEKFPLPLVAQDLTIVKENDGATVRDAVLTTLAGGHATLNASADLLKLEDPGVPFVPEITLEGHDIPVEALLVHAVPESISGSETSPRKILETLGIGGKIASASVRIGMTPTNDVGYSITLDVGEGQARPASSRPDVPAPRVGVRSLSGKVLLTQDHLRMDMKGDIFRLDSPEAASPVAYQADITFEDGKDTTYTADIRAPRFDISFAAEDFVAPISRSSAGKIAELRSKYFPTGVVEAAVHVQSPATSGGETQVRIVATDPSLDIDYESARVGLHGAKGVVTIDVGSPGRVAIDSLEGDLIVDAISGGRVSVRGATTLDLTPASDTEALSIDLDGGAFEAPLTRRVVEKAMNQGVLSWYDRLKPRGSFATSMVLTPDPESGPSEPSPDAPRERAWLVRGTLVPRSLIITTAKGEVPFTKVGGTITFWTGGGLLEGLRLESREWSVDADGSWNAMESGATSVHVDLGGSCRSLPETLLDLLPPEVGELATDLKFKAPNEVTLRDSSIAMILPAEVPGIEADSHPDQTRFTGTFETSGASADVGAIVTNLDAAASLTYDSVDGVGTFDVRLLARSALVEGVEMTLARARVSGTSGGETIVPLFAADCHGGRVAGTATISPTDDGRKSFLVDARISDARFASVLADVQENRRQSQAAVVERTSGPMASPARSPLDAQPTAALRQGDLDESRGRLDAEFTLAGIVNDARSRRGRGTLIVGGERVINIPLLVPLMRISNLQLPINERLDFASARFFLSGDVLNMEEMLVSSRSVAIEGVGTATLPNYDLDLRFKARNKTGIPIISRIVESIRNELVTGEVRGTIANPSIKLRPFAGTTRFMNAAVGKDRTGPQRWLDELESQPRTPVVPASKPLGPVSPQP